ncbi:hypothetical protein I4U23_030718 [Adineta vaga]|nr:hypothetical protein I4U23_030718 [Adineta vaga]
MMNSPKNDMLSTSSLGGDQCYFEKLRSSSERGHIHQRKLYRTPINISFDSANPLDNTMKQLMETSQPCNPWSSDNKTDDTVEIDLLLSHIHSLKQLHINNQLREKEDFYTSTFSMITEDGNIVFDFSKQSINDEIYMRLLQFVRLSNLDRFIEKIFDKLNEYHHVDYGEKRRIELQNEQKSYYKISSNRFDQKSNSTHLHSPLISPRLNSKEKTNCYLTMAKAVHFRSLTHCFILNGIDISPRFHYDRTIIRDTCLRFHSFINPKLDHDLLNSNSKPILLVLCSQEMKQIYQLLESLLKPYISSNISIIYLTFEQIKPFLLKYQLSDQKTLHNESFSQQNQNTVESELLEKSTYFRLSSLILIFMKQFDENYFQALIRWYIDILHNSNLQSKQATISDVIEHFWLITCDYQYAQKCFTIPKTNLFLWPTEHDDLDHMSIIISSILILPTALTINDEIYSNLIDGMTIVDNHCREMIMERNVCIQMALLRIWLTLCSNKTIRIMTCNDELERFREFTQILLTKYENINEQKISDDENFVSYDFIIIRNHIKNESDIIPGKMKLIIMEKLSSPYTVISLDQLTPLTLGVLIGVYQMSIFFENIIHEQLFQRQSNLFI